MFHGRVIGELLTPAFTIEPQALTTTTNGATVDRNAAGTNNFLSAMVVYNVQAVSGTSPTLNLALQESVDGVTWTAANDHTGTAITIAQITAATANKQLNLDLMLRQRYLRWVATIGGTTPSFTMCVLFVFGVASVGPTNTVDANNP